MKFQKLLSRLELTALPWLGGQQPGLPSVDRTSMASVRERLQKIKARALILAETTVHLLLGLQLWSKSAWKRAVEVLGL